MTIETNKELVRRYQDAHNANNLGALDAIVADDLITHNHMPGLPAGLAGGKQVHQMAVAAIPDFNATIEDLIAEGDKVVARMTFRGTHTAGAFMGIPPSGRAFVFSAISIFRIADVYRRHDRLEAIILAGDSNTPATLTSGGPSRVLAPAPFTITPIEVASP